MALIAEDLGGSGCLKFGTLRNLWLVWQIAVIVVGRCLGTSGDKREFSDHVASVIATKRLK